MGKPKKPLDKPPSGMALAAAWPVYEVLLSHGWAKQAALITILIARRSPKSGKVAVGSFLVDLACLGVKSVQVRLCKDVAEYTAGLRAHVQRIQPMAPAEFALAAKIIVTGYEYAAGLGFKPDPVYAQAQYLLADADLASCTTPVPTGGPEGKPFFVRGPHDDVDRIIAQLTRAVGEGNFHFMLSAGPGDI
ncbi:MAG: hypothetical protein U0Z44_08550 [Kouleothrix sp.]